MFACSFAAPVIAQVTPFAEVAGYNVAQVENSPVCFAAVQLPSDKGDEMLYTYYQAQAGQRWHVIGYVADIALGNQSVSLNVSIDGTETLVRETETRDGDFMLPFEALEEIRGHEDLAKTGEAMVIAFNGVDSLSVPLADFREALALVQDCLVQA